MTEITVDLPREGALPSFDGATGWLNSPPLSPMELRGKVVLVDFGRTRASTGFARSATCARGTRNTRIKGWSSSASTPRSFRSSTTSTTSARPLRRCGSSYPIALDSSDAVWRAFTKSLLAGRVHRRPGGTDPAPPVRRGRLRGVRAGHPAVAGHRRRPGLGRRRWFRGASGLGEPAVSRDLPRLRIGRLDGFERSQHPERSRGRNRVPVPCA